jgi:PPOX class probable F420-dependent enzyme
MAADLDLVRTLAQESGWLAVVATTRPDGTIHASLVSAGVVDDPTGGGPAVGMVVGGSARKLAHLRQSGRAVATFRAGWRWVSVEGPVRIVGPDDPVDEVPPTEVPQLLRRVFRGAGGTHEDWDAYDRAMAAERRAAVFIALARILTTG